jgi:tRNA threonylcarbamoyladenosine biosynthesis protein TsaE
VTDSPVGATSSVGATFRSGVFESSSEAETGEVGALLASHLKPGDVILLYGDLGAGKTAFVRGLARGLGANPEDVSSPTFTIIQEYPSPAGTLYHVDLYRLEPAEIDDLGLDDILSSGGIVAIEWADRWPARPREVTEVRIEAAGDDTRRIDLRPSPRG